MHYPIGRKSGIAPIIIGVVDDATLVRRRRGYAVQVVLTRHRRSSAFQKQRRQRGIGIDARRAHAVLVGSSHGWLGLINYGGRMVLLNPLSWRRMELPPLRGKPFSPREEWRRPSKLILSHPPDEEECRAVMILRGKDKAAFCRPNRSSVWTPLGDWSQSSGNRLYTEMAYSPARNSLVMHVQTPAGSELEFWNMADPYRPVLYYLNQFGRVDMDSIWTWQTYLVPLRDEIGVFLLRRYTVTPKTIDYFVYRIDDFTKAPARCSNVELGDLAMFVGINHSFALTTATSQLKRRSIYLSDGRFDHDPQDIEVFSYETFETDPLDYSFRGHPTVSPMPWLITPDAPHD